MYSYKQYELWLLQILGNNWCFSLFYFSSLSYGELNLHSSMINNVEHFIDLLTILLSFVNVWLSLFIFNWTDF